ncbi:MAG: sugar ABC transporter ATP-binding protein [Chloroflexi bacterium]|jgi:ABC-type sugar transport system ATPase subunit|nr:sugar ABC transporter ATP-binding protein [Anaerolineaceae bacterium]NMB88432.1 sugar ABC transporter ATP-binding protein [Chloroflexota bacterium]
MPDLENDILLEMKGITKRFPGTLALDDIQFSVRRGEIHALMGENGAGKSTLMKIAVGLYEPDSGEIRFDGQAVHFSGPAEAIQAGLSMIHQELNPILHMTVAENIFLHREPTLLGQLFVDKRAINLQAAEILKKYHLDIDPRTKMVDLTIAHMQMIEIIKAVTFNAKLVIMDEPTSSLDSDETENLFRTIAELKAKGITVIYISHRIEEIARICDRVTVFRDGRFIGTRDVADIDRNTLITMMVGRQLADVYNKVPTQAGDVVLQVRHLTRKGIFEDISFEVRAGEILGFSGLVGAGRSDIAKSIFGLEPLDSGEIIWQGRPLRIRNTSEAIGHGIAMVTEDRKKYGLVLCRSLFENIALPNLKKQQRGVFIHYGPLHANISQLANRLSIKAPNLKVDARSLSGGNQQKVILAKWLMDTPQLMILDEPTRGIDIGAKSEIYRLMSEFTAHGMAIILISSEMEEVIGMSDRILVVHEGRINGEFFARDLTDKFKAQELILNKALGG